MQKLIIMVKCEISCTLGFPSVSASLPKSLFGALHAFGPRTAISKSASNSKVITQNQAMTETISVALYKLTGCCPVVLMASTSITGMNTGVSLIIQAFAEGSQLFKQRRKRRARGRAVGQEELEASLYNGEKLVEAKLTSLTLMHESRFDVADSE